MPSISEKSKDLESEGWFLLEQFGDDATEDAKSLFEESIALGNDGAYVGLCSVNQNFSKEQNLQLLAKAAKCGRLDAVAALVNLLGEKDDNQSLYMWCFILENYSKYTFHLNSSTENLKGFLTQEQIVTAVEDAKRFSEKVVSDGYEFFDGY